MSLKFQKIEELDRRLNIVNHIDNGDFDVAQLATSFSSLSSDDELLDRWRWYSNTDGSRTITQDTDVPTFAQSGHQSEYSLKIDVTATDTTLSSTYEYISYLMEGYDYKRIHNRSCVLSFWVKSTKTGTFCVSFQNGAVDRSYIVEVDVDASDTWEKKEIPITFNASGTWNFTNGTGLYINFARQVGSNAQGTANQWNSDDNTITSNQDNFADSTSNNFLISQVQLEIGDKASKFTTPSFAETLAKCQRYIEKSYDYSVAPGATSNPGRTSMYSVSQGAIHMVDFKVSKRATPTITVYNPVSGNSGEWYDYYSSVADSTDLSVVAGINSFFGINTSVSGGRDYGFQWLAKALLP
jgi:hypothetical protein